MHMCLNWLKSTLVWVKILCEYYCETLYLRASLSGEWITGSSPSDTGAQSGTIGQTRSRPQSWSQSDLSPICLNPSSSQKSAVLYVWHRTPLHLNTLSCHPHVNQLQVLFRGPVSRRPRNHFRRLLVMPCMKACVYWCTCVCQHVFGSQRVGLTQGDGWQSKPECVPECVL